MDPEHAPTPGSAPAEPTTADLLAELDSLRRRLDDAERTIAAHSGTGSDAPQSVRVAPPSPPTDRRDLLKRAGVAAGVAAVAGLATSAVTAPPAAAWSGDPLIMGVSNNAATDPTRARNVSTDDDHLFEFSDSSTGSAANAGRATLVGYAEDLEFAVLAHSQRQAGIAVRARTSGDDSVAVSANATGADTTGISATAGRTGIQTLMSAVDDNAGITVLGGRRGLVTGGCHLPLSIAPAGDPGPPVALGFDYRIGDVYVDGEGSLYHCIAAGSPGQWRQVTGPSTAGAFTAVNPTRVYDSRLGSGPGTGRITGGQERVTSVANGIDALTGSVSVPGLVPAGATAIQYNLTVVETSGSGFLQVSPSDVTGVTSSSINWYQSNQIVANGLVVRLGGDRQVRTSAGGGSTHYVIDVLGYYR